MFREYVLDCNGHCLEATAYACAEESVSAQLLAQAISPSHGSTYLSGKAVQTRAMLIKVIEGRV
jgi:hypothetical protein